MSISRVLSTAALYASFPHSSCESELERGTDGRRNRRGVGAGDNETVAIADRDATIKTQPGVLITILFEL